MTFTQYIDHDFKPKSLGIIDQANTIIDEMQAEGFTLTLRQLYYQFVAKDLIENTQKSYNALGGTISKARLAGLVSWEAIEDRTRFLRGVGHDSSVSSSLFWLARGFTLNKWEGAPTRVEVWIEKDALVGVIDRVCRKMDVDFFSCRGYVSLTAMWEAGERFNGYDEANEVIVLHLGDHDPSGIDMTRDIEARLNLFSDTQSVTVERIALNMDQIEKFKPPPNFAKLSDSRAKDYIAQYGSEAFELDALKPTFMAELIEEKILVHRDQEVWDRNLARQEKDRATLRKLSEKY